MTQGATERTIIVSCLRQGKELPDSLQNCPALGFGLELYFDAFNELNMDRPIGMTEGRIPRRDIIDYCKELDLSEEETEDLLYHIRGLDGVYLRLSRNDSS